MLKLHDMYILHHLHSYSLSRYTDKDSNWTRQPPRQSEPEVNHLQISNLNQNEQVKPLKPRICSWHLAQTKPLQIPIES